LDNYPAHQTRQEDRHEALEDAPAQFLDVVEEGHFAPVLTSLRHAGPPQTPAPDAGEATAPGAGACRARGWPLESGRKRRSPGRSMSVRPPCRPAARRGTPACREPTVPAAHSERPSTPADTPPPPRAAPPR